MKLYTEEQVTELTTAAFTAGQNHNPAIFGVAFEKTTPIELPSDSLCINCDESKSTHNVCMDCMIKIGKENIELPSDEEIEQEMNNEYPLTGHVGIDHRNYLRKVGFIQCAKWMRDKIQGGNNEQQ